jgi:curved DNA-binding protein CbpA
MNTQSTLDLCGNFRTHPFAELLIEISSAKLSGSLRVSREDKKAIVYFELGVIALVVSNEREFRLSEIFMEQGLIAPGVAKEKSHLSNDIQLAEYLVRSRALTNEQSDEAFKNQGRAILTATLGWPDGDWIFSPLTRLKTGMSLSIGFYRLLAEYSRGLSASDVSGRFRSLKESFARRTDADLQFDLQPHEAFILSRLDFSPLNLEQVIALSGLPESEAMHVLYVLWLGGLLDRHDWNPTFSGMKISMILSANLELTKSPSRPAVRRGRSTIEKAVGEADDEATPAEINISLDEYLERLENADSYYELLNIPPSAKLNSIRKSYFGLAKLFHPDRYHRVEPKLRGRIQNAFTELAQAHETLRNPDARRAYDQKLRGEEEEKLLRRKKEDAGENYERNVQEGQASEDFERGFRLQLEGKFEAALPFLARAVYYAPRNARYHAYFGKALSDDDTQRHKAESELQTAIRLEPDNPSFRLMLAEFFIRIQLLKRAQGELNRLLARFPDNEQALALLDSLHAN